MFGTQACKSAWLAVIAIMLAGSSSLSAEEVDARALLGRMSEEIAGLDSFVLRGEAYVDARLAAGQLIEHSSEVTMRIRRPDLMRLTMADGEGVKELYFGGGLLTLYSQKENFYTQAKIPGGIEAAADFAVNEVGIDAPMLDFLSNSIASRLQQDAEKVQYLGPSLIRGNTFDHVAIRLPEIDVQIWIAAKGLPLPGKMVISSKWEGGSPRTVVFFSWDTEPDFPADNVKFVPPQDATEIELVLDP
jgi:hypothetical protein